MVLCKFLVIFISCQSLLLWDGISFHQNDRPLLVLHSRFLLRFSSSLLLCCLAKCTFCGLPWVYRWRRLCSSSQAVSCNDLSILILRLEGSVMPEIYLKITHKEAQGVNNAWLHSVLWLSSEDRVNRETVTNNISNLPCAAPSDILMYSVFKDPIPFKTRLMVQLQLAGECLHVVKRLKQDSS